MVFLTGLLSANPEGMKVVSGSADIINSQNELRVNAADRTVINWDKFSIGKDELTKFCLPSSFSSVLNRVSGKEVSKILGRLESNGKVYLLNPNGIIFGKDAYINTNSFIASTYDVLDSEFLKNGDLCFSGESNEKIINLGTIKSLDGDAILIAKFIQNEGSIDAEKGVAALAVGKEVLLKPLSKERIYIKPQIANESADVGIENKGEIKALSAYLKADGNLYSLAIKDSGRIDALGFEEKGGEIFLIAENSTVETSGNLKATGKKGGEIRLLGKNVGLLEKACLDVSGENDGGSVLIGGDFQGKNENIHSAEAVFAGDVSINASSLKDGNGGKVILWSDECTKFYGSIAAEGGKIKGNGGLVEVSGKYLEYKGKVSTKAFSGIFGQLLLDPPFITIDPTHATSPSWGPLPHTIYAPPYTGADAFLLAADLSAALASNDVTVSAQGDFQWEGIFIDPNSQVTWNVPTKLTLITANNSDQSVFISGGGGTDTFIYAQGGGEIIINTSVVFFDPGNNHNTYLRTDNGKINISCHDSAFLNGELSVSGGSTGGFGAIIATGTGTIDISVDDHIDIFSPSQAFPIPPIQNTDAQIRAENGHIICTVTKADGEIQINGDENETHTGNNISAGIYTTGTGDITLNTAKLGISFEFNPHFNNTRAGVYALGTGNITINCTTDLSIEADPLGATEILAATGSISGFVTNSISLTSNAQRAAISAPLNQVSLTSCGAVTLTAGGAASASIESNTGTVMSSTRSITMVPTSGDTFIKSGISGGSGVIQINPTTPGSGGIVLNQAGAAHASYISSDNGGNIACKFSSPSSFTAGTNAGNLSGIYTGRLAGGGDISFESGNLTLIGGGDATATAGLFAGNAVAGDINFKVGGLTATASDGRAGIFASTSIGSDITGFSNSINLTSGFAACSISAPNGTLTLTPSGAITLTANEPGNCSIESNTALQINDAPSITMIPSSGNTFISSGISGGSGTVSINAGTPGSGGVVLNQAGATHASYISSDNGGDITCRFLGTSIFTSGASEGSIVGIYSGRLASGGNITFQSGNLTLTGGGTVDGTAGIFAGNAAVGTINFTIGALTGTASAGSAGIFASTTGISNITGTVNGINLTSGSAVCSISAPSGSVTLTPGGAIALTANGTGRCSIESNTALQIDTAPSITMVPTSGDTFIKSGVSGGSGTVSINSSAAGSGGVILNQAGAAHASYISSDNGGDITCKFSGASSFTAGANAGNISGIYSGRLASGGNITFLSGNLTIIGGGNAAATAGIFAGNAAVGTINFSTGALTATASAGSAGIFASTTGASNIVGSATNINLTSGSAVCSISAPNGSLTLNPTRAIVLRANGAGNCSIESNTALQMENTGSLEMIPSAGDTFIKSGVSGGSGSVSINAIATPTGPILLNQAGAAHASYISSDNGGDITCKFLGASSFTAGANAGNISGVFSGRVSGNGNIDFSSGNLTILGGGNLSARAGLFTSNNGAAGINFNVGQLTATANVGQAGIFSSAVGGNITGSATGINLTSGSATAAIFAQGTGFISLTRCGDIVLTAGNTADCFIQGQTGATLLLASSVTMASTAGITYIATVSGNLKINDASAPGSGGISMSGNFSSAIETKTSGDIECYFLGNSSLTGGTTLNAFSRIGTITPPGGNITLSTNNLSLNGGTGQGCYATITANGSGFVFFPSVGNITMTAGNGLADSYASIETGNGGSIVANFLSPKGSLNMTAGTPNGSYAVMRPGPSGSIAAYFSNPSVFQAGSGVGSIAGAYASTGDIFLFLGDLTMIGGSGNANSSAIETTNGGSIEVLSTGNLFLQGGSSAACQALIQTNAVGGSIDVATSGKITLQGGSAAATSSIIQTLGGAGNPVSVSAGEVLLNSSTTDNTSVAAIASANTASFVTVIANGTANALGDISIIANAAEAFIKNAILVRASHDLLISSIQNNAYILTSSSATPSIEVGNDFLMRSFSLLNTARVTPEGAATDLNLTVGDDMFLNGLVGSSFISGYNNINASAGDNLALSGISGQAFISSVSGNYTLNSLDIGAIFADAFITATSLNLNVFQNSMTLQSVGPADAYIQATNAAINVNGSLSISAASSGLAYIQSASLSPFNIGFDMNLSGSNAYILKTGAGALTITAGDTVSLNSGSYIQNDIGPMTILAGQDMIVNQSRIENMTTADLTLVVDNNFPTSPEIGDGHFEIGTGSTIQTADGGKLRIFSAAREFNTIESPLNRIPFVPGALFIDSNQEVWGLYYPQSFFGGPGFTIFYKNEEDFSHFLLSRVDFAASELFFRLNNMIPDFTIIDYLQKFIDRSKYYFIIDKRDMLDGKTRNLIKLSRE